MAGICRKCGRYVENVVVMENSQCDECDEREEGFV